MATERDETSKPDIQAPLGSRGGGDIVSKDVPPRPADDNPKQEADSKQY
jgi:hypothetical protein